MAAPLLVTWEMAHVNGLPEDAVVNNFAISWQGAGLPAPADFSAMAVALREFWIVGQTTTTLESYLSDEISRAADSIEIKAYDLTGNLDGSPHGSPIYANTTNLNGAGGGTDLPSEVAAVLTLRGIGWQAALVEAADSGDPGTALDRPRQRLSGRLYIGPLNTTAMATVSQVQRLSAAFITDVLDAAEVLDAALTAADFDWCVWSRVLGAFNTLTHVEMDNAFDTQRRRGAAASARTQRVL